MKKITRQFVIAAIVNILLNKIRKVATTDTEGKMQEKLTLTDEKRAKLRALLRELEEYEQVDPLVAPKNLMAGIQRKTENILLQAWKKEKGPGEYLVALRVLNGDKPVPNAVLRIGTQRFFVDLEPTDIYGMVFKKITVPRDLVFMVVHENGTSIPMALFNKTNKE